MEIEPKQTDFYKPLALYWFFFSSDEQRRSSMHFDSPTPPIISNTKNGSSDKLAQPLDASNGVPGSPKV